ncbi:MAG: hypothetical protein KatS3mg031_1261 [Chitinophagales bacterium]|nr:MAG: hypothetical protein KatS3mg031_1261 [Chitinophagales bacterium]
MKVTVLMPVYNAEKYLHEAIDSILTQTFTDFELLIINDGSTDKSRDIITSFTDRRIRLVDNATNLRLIATLNKGLELAGGELIARMDADDICLPQRLEKQVAFMDQHPEVGLCGTFLRTIGFEKDYDITFATDHDAIKFRLFFDTHFPHPAAMLRKSVLDRHQLRFDKTFIHAEDFELWNRMAEVCRLAIIPEVLVLKRHHAAQISSVYTETQDKISRMIRERLLRRLGVIPTPDAMDVYENFLKHVWPRKKQSLETLLDLIENMVVANRKTLVYQPALFEKFFAEKYWQLCTRSTHTGLWIYLKFRQSLFYKEKLFPVHAESRFLLKSIIRYSYYA